MKKKDETEIIKTKQKLLRLLHVFVLPALKLRTDELSDLQKILSWIEHQHQSIEIMIGKRDKTKFNIENSLREQRIKLLSDENFAAQQYVAKCDRDFLEIFLKHLQKDISLSNEKLLTFDKEIRPLRDSVGEADIKKLGKYRAERDQTLAYLNNALEARETIKNVIGRPHIGNRFKPSKRPVSQPFHVVYLEIARRLQDFNREIQDLIKTKIKISSVREATLLAIDEIMEDGQSFGYERKAGKFEYETDIYDPKNKPEEWATISEKIADLLKAKPLGFRDSHEKFCRMIKLKCQRLFDDSKLFSSPELSNIRTDVDARVSVPVSPDTAHVLELLGQSSINRRSTKSVIYHRSERHADTRSRSYSSRFSFGSIPKEATEAICKEIIMHISEMAETLAQELYKTPLDGIHRSVINKIYICYESHISTELMPVLHQLYEQSYRQQCEGLSRWISQISLSEIGFDDTKFEALTSPATATRIERKREGDYSCDETEVKVPFGDQRRRISLGSISKLSIDELYEISNREFAGRQSLLSCAPGMDGWFEVNGPEHKDFIEADDLDMGQGQELVTQKDDTALTHAIDVDERGVSPTDSNIGKAENMIETVSSSQERTEHVTKPKLVNGLHEFSNVEMRRPQSFFDPPPYEEVVMRRSIKPPEKVVVGYDSLHEEAVMRRHSPPPDYSTVTPAKAAFFNAFVNFEPIVKKETEAVSLFKKLRQMTKAIQYIEREVTKLRDDGKSNVLVCADDILDIVVLLLSNLDSETLLKLYAHMNLMIHLSPTFMHGNAHDYALVTFNVAYQHMFEQQVLSNSPKL